MRSFATGHAVHADWRVALARAVAQLEAVGPARWTLGFVYLTDYYVPHAESIVAELQRRFDGVSWTGCTGVGVCAGDTESIDEPALAVMLAALPRSSFELYSGVRPLQRTDAAGVLVHADAETAELPELLHELSQRSASGYLFGGLAAARTAALHIADGVWRGGLSGVAFGAGAPFVSRVTQGCQPIGATRRVTRCHDNVVEALDDVPALDVLLQELAIDDIDDHRAALPKLRATLAGLVDAGDEAIDRGGQFGADVRVRHLVGIDPGRRAVALADRVEPGMRLAFCHRDVEAARRDLVRICSEIRDELVVEVPAGAPVTGRRRGDRAAGLARGTRQRAMRGAVYVSCAGRGGPHFGGPSAELKILRHALGEVPLVGFFAGGEIAHRHLYGYTGVLTVFTDPAPSGAASGSSAAPT